MKSTVRGERIGKRWRNLEEACIGGGVFGRGHWAGVEESRGDGGGCLYEPRIGVGLAELRTG